MPWVSQSIDCLILSLNLSPELDKPSTYLLLRLFKSKRGIPKPSRVERLCKTAIDLREYFIESLFM